MEGRLQSHSQASTSLPSPEPCLRRARRAARNAAWLPAPTRSGAPQTERRQLRVAAAVTAPAKPGAVRRVEGHSALLQGLGRLGDVAPSHMPWLLRLAHIRHAVAGHQLHIRTCPASLRLNCSNVERGATHEVDMSGAQIEA